MHCTEVQYPTVQLQCSPVQYSAVQYSTVCYKNNAVEASVMCRPVLVGLTAAAALQYSAVYCITVQYNAVYCIKYSIVQCSAVQCSAVQCLLAAVHCSGAVPGAGPMNSRKT